jgi:NitT/TauT family transport system substrate-binding protein
MRENREMTEEILLQAIEKIRQYNLLSSDTFKRDVGLMENKIWNNFFKIMSDNGVYEKDLNWEDAFTLDFLNIDNN